MGNSDSKDTEHQGLHAFTKSEQVHLKALFHDLAAGSDVIKESRLQVLLY